MPKTDPAHERPSWVSLALIVCSGLAVVLTAGWLAMMIMEWKGGGTADSADAAVDDAALPPHVENADPPYVPPMSAAMPYATADGAAASDASASGVPGAASGARLSSLGGAPTSALATAPTNFGGPGDLLNLDPPETANAAAPESVPLPPPRPRRTAAVPVPRSRPPIDNPAAQAPHGWSLFDLFVDRQH
jgi:hypothetical protein